jgi:hypothetical protein
MEHVTYFEITSNEMFVHYRHKRQTLTIEECIKIVYVLLSSILYTFVFYICNTTLIVVCYVLSSEWLLGPGIF